MFLQISPELPPPTPWYKENPFMTAITLVCGFVVAWITPAFNRWAIWAEWPCVSYVLWCVVRGTAWPPYFSKSKRTRIYGGILITVLIGLSIWRIDHWTTQVERSSKNAWQLQSCSVVKDDRVREGHSVRLTLSGPTVIEATVWEDECRIPVGTEFHREGGLVCNPSVAGPNDLGCFGIESEKPR
jgi:hypothetical protein